MKTYTLLFLITAILSYSCTKDHCDDVSKEEVERPALSEEYLKWVKPLDTTPLFKLTTYDAQGNVAAIETLQGEYTVKYSDNQLILPNCDHAQGIYKRADLKLDLNRLNGDDYSGYYITLDNRVRKEGFTVSFPGEGDKAKFDDQTLLDTALINGKIYQNVYKLKTSGSTFESYYAKSHGFIYIKTTKIIELIP